MSVAIDELIVEPAPGGGQPAKQSQAKGARASQPLDIDKLDYERQRSRHRSERLWAD